MAEGKGCFIRVRGALVAVTPDVYHVCHKTKRQAKTVYEKDERNDLVSYDGMDTEDTLGVETISDPSAPSAGGHSAEQDVSGETPPLLISTYRDRTVLGLRTFYEEKTEREYADALGR